MTQTITAPRHRDAAPTPTRRTHAPLSERVYTIRYRGTGPAGRLSLIVEDEGGTAYLFCGGELRAQRSGAHASARLKTILARYTAWSAIPHVAPYTLAGLGALIGTGVAEADR
jgi:hypothetical protein